VKPGERFKAWLRKDTTQRHFAIGMVALAASSIDFLLRDTDRRLDALEERGLVPIDDLATVGDLGKLEKRIKELEPVHPSPEETL
jgi:hypothetical protein